MRRMLMAAVVLATLALAPTALGWTWPVDGPVLRPYFFTILPEPIAGHHRGVDIGAAPGTEVRAPATGLVTFAGTLPQGGRGLTIQTADGLSVTLLQLAATFAPRGTPVAEGAVVALAGPSSDPVTADPHVHLGVRVTAEEEGYVDPLTLLPARDTPAAPPATAPAATKTTEATVICQVPRPVPIPRS